MSRAVLVLRPEPGATASAARAEALGLTAYVAPLFRIVPRAWQLPETQPDALLVTSANAARSISGRMDVTRRVYAVGEATASVLRAVGFHDLMVGCGGVADLVARAAADGQRSLLHLTGEDRTAFDPLGLSIDTRVVYAAEPCDPGPAFVAARANDAIALLHSVRAADRFRELAASRGDIAAISPAVVAAAGSGWSRVAIAELPTDAALLAAASALCQGRG